MTVDKDKIIGHKHKEYESQPIKSFQEYYKNITQEDQRMAMTSNDTITDMTCNLQNSINIRDCKDEKQQVVVAKEVKINIKGKQQIPSKHDILKSSTVGKPSPDHSFTSEACFEHIIIFLLKSEYLNEEDHRTILASHPLILHLNKMLHWSKDIHFLDLKII